MSARSEVFALALIFLAPSMARIALPDDACSDSPDAGSTRRPLPLGKILNLKFGSEASS
jgi:hypothetical protein